MITSPQQSPCMIYSAILTSFVFCLHTRLRVWACLPLDTLAVTWLVGNSNSWISKQLLGLGFATWYRITTNKPSFSSVDTWFRWQIKYWHVLADWCVVWQKTHIQNRPRRIFYWCSVNGGLDTFIPILNQRRLPPACSLIRIYVAQSSVNPAKSRSVDRVSVFWQIWPRI